MLTKILAITVFLLSAVCMPAYAHSTSFNPTGYKMAYILNTIIAGKGMPAVGSKVIWRRGAATLEKNAETHKYRLVFENYKHRLVNLKRVNNKYTHAVSAASAHKILATLKNPKGCKRLWQNNTCYSQKITSANGKHIIWMPTKEHYYVTVTKLYPHNILMHLDAIRFSGNGEYFYAFK